MSGKSRGTGKPRSIPNRRAGTPPQTDRSDLFALASRVVELHRQALAAYTPTVEEMIRSNCHDTQQIEHTLDGLLEACAFVPADSLFHHLREHYARIDPAAAASYAEFYRDMRDSDNLPEGANPHE